MQSRNTTQVPSNQAATITHNVSLSFEIGTSHIHSQSLSRRNINTDEGDDSLDRASNEDRNGKSQDISHGENHDMRSGYSTSSTNDQGNPHGIRPENDCQNGIQGINSTKLSPGEELIRQPVKVKGKPKGISQSLRKSQIANPAPVILIHPEIVRYCKSADIDSDFKIKLMLQESYPSSGSFFKEVQESEKIAITIMKTCDPPSMLIRPKQKFYRHIKQINSYRISKKIPPFPDKILDVKIRLLSPGCPTFIPEYNEFEQYRERVRLIQVECEVIEMIISGKIPKMSIEEKQRLQDDLIVINQIRMDDDFDAFGPLDLSKTFDEHIIIHQKQREAVYHTGPKYQIHDTDSEEDEDDDIFSNSDDDSDSSVNNSDSGARSEDTNNMKIDHDINQDDVIDLCNETSPSDNEMQINLKDQAVQKSEEEPECIVAKRLKIFLTELNEMTICPITHLQFQDPYVGTDKCCYERRAISEWLAKKNYLHLVVNRCKYTL